MKMTKYLSLLLGILPTAPLCAQWELNEADGYRLIVVKMCIRDRGIGTPKVAEDRKSLSDTIISGKGKAGC